MEDIYNSKSGIVKTIIISKFALYIAIK